VHAGRDGDQAEGHEGEKLRHRMLLRFVPTRRKLTVVAAQSLPTPMPMLMERSVVPSNAESSALRPRTFRRYVLLFWIRRSVRLVMPSGWT
jgi:hypothetical protein